MCVRSVTLRIILATIIIGAAHTVLAQSTATITGTVRDAQTGDPLPGASVQIQNTGLGGSADMDGKFIIRNVPPGPHALQAVYIGYIRRLVIVEVRGSEILKQDIKLTAVGIESEEVLVTAQAAGQNAAINQQLSALPIVNVVSRDRVQELPDANAAESVSRLPGVSLIRTGGEGSKVVVRGLSPQFNRITIDGVEMPSNVTSANNIVGLSKDGGGLAASGENLGDRGEDLSMVSSIMLGGITVTKAITPDMDAAVLGGVVDFELRKAARAAPAVDDERRWLPLFELKVQGGYAGLKDSYDNYRYVGSLERRFFDQSFGIFIQASGEKRNLSSNMLEAEYLLSDRSHGDAPLPRIEGLRFGDVFRKRQRYGGTVVLDYQHGTGEIALMNFLSTSKTQEIMRGEQMDPEGRLQWRAALVYGANETNNELNVLSNLLSIKQELSTVQAEFKLSHSYSDSRNPEDLYTQFWQRSSLAAFTNHGDVSYVEPKVLASYARPDAANAFHGGGGLTRSVSQERCITSSLDLGVDFSLYGSLSGRIKAGGMFQHRTRDYDFNLRGIPGFSWEGLQDTRFLHTEYPWLIWDSNGWLRMDSFTQDSYHYGELLNGDYSLAYPMNMGRLWEISLRIKRHPNYQPDRLRMENLINDYTGYENKSAGFAMVTVKIGEDLTVLPGVRYQNLTTSYTALRGTAVLGIEQNYHVQGGDATLTYAHGYWLPMIHARYRPFDWMQFHFAYTNTLNYPDYSALTPRYVVYPGFIDYNNHGLEPATSENLDLVLSLQSNEIGLLSFTGFKKKIKNLVFFSKTYVGDLSKYPDLPQGGNQLYTFHTYINNPIPVDLWGFETEWQTHFWYLPRPFDGLVLNVNYTHIFSEASYPRSIVNTAYDDEGNMIRWVTDTSYTARMLNQPNDIVNLALGYDLGGFSLRLSLLYQDNIFKRPDFWMQQRVNSEKFTRWDLSVKQSLPWTGLQLFFSVNNITGEDDIDVNQKNGFPASQQRYGMSADLGLQIRL